MASWEQSGSGCFWGSQITGHRGPGVTSSDRFCGRAVLGQSRSAVLVLPIAPGTLWRDPKPSQQTTSLPSRRLLGARGFQALSSGHFVLHLLHLSSTTPSSWKSSLTSPGRIRSLLQAEVNPASLSLGPGEGRLGGGTPPGWMMRAGRCPQLDLG